MSFNIKDGCGGKLGGKIVKTYVFFVSLGCDKNLVDSEVMLGYINKVGLTITDDETVADIIIINTCSFIHDAKEESIETILEMAKYKEHGSCKGIIVTGCLTERYKEELLKEIPEIDGALGTSNYDEIVETIEQVLNKKKVVSFKNIDYTPETFVERMVNMTVPYAYLKIAEGCNNRCSYCIIPDLRGRVRSRTIESLVKETKYLVRQGKQEIILVAQDLTKYGIDIYKEKALPKLLKALCQIEDLKWVRLLYCYPEDITDELITVMAEEEKILHYIDMPIQHINDTILNNMYRRSDRHTIETVINKLRSRIPDICIRSTVIVGFPGETEEQFKELENFVEDYQLDRLGAFTYSIEEGTKAARMQGQLDEAIKIRRRDSLMALQQQISFKNNQKMLGKDIDVLIEGFIPDQGIYCGRCYKDAPDVDGMVFIDTEYELMTGQIVKVKVVEANEYDIIGVIADESSK